LVIVNTAAINMGTQVSQLQVDVGSFGGNSYSSNGIVGSHRGSIFRF
jgi:hypothetical protein